MRKLKLEVEELAVESFQTQSESEGRGTVKAHEATDAWTCGSCGDTDTFFDDSCGPTCGGVCGPTTYAMHDCTEPMLY